MSKLLTIGILLIAFTISGYSYLAQKPSFEDLSPQEMYETIISQRNHAIGKAKEEGNYHCCIEPPCTMCYMEANQWNNHTAGTCACDDLIAEGKEPCPQCKRGLCSNEQESSCTVSN